MAVLSDDFAHGIEQSVISKPAISHDQYGDSMKGSRNFREHFNSLLELGLEQHRFAINLNLSCLNHFFHMEEAKGQGHEGPATFDNF